MFDTDTLMERNSGGALVTLDYEPQYGLTFVVVKIGDTRRAVQVPAEKALDAFYHPSLYLSEEENKAVTFVDRRN